MKKLLHTLVLTIASLPSFSQQRLSDPNTIGWFVYTGTFAINPKLAVHTEYQWRRADGIKNWQQGLLRTGINYALRKDVSLNAGYAFAESFPYGNYPVRTAFPEHRVYEQLVLKSSAGRVEISHRFTLEQRFLGKVSLEDNKKITDWIYLNRARYRLRAELPLTNKQREKNAWSIALMDEIFIGFGKNVAANVFDQNRFALLLNYKASPKLKFEAGFLNQVVQQAARVNDTPVFQYNNGFMLATHVMWR